MKKKIQGGGGKKLYKSISGDDDDDKINWKVYDRSTSTSGCWDHLIMLVSLLEPDRTGYNGIFTTFDWTQLL